MFIILAGEPFTGLPERAVNAVVCEAKSKILKYKEAQINERKSEHEPRKPV